MRFTWRPGRVFRCMCARWGGRRLRHPPPPESTRVLRGGRQPVVPHRWGCCVTSGGRNPHARQKLPAPDQDREVRSDPRLRKTEE